MIRVWPLVEGLNTYNAVGRPTNGAVGVRCYMNDQDAREAQERGDVQFCAGLSTDALRKPAPRVMRAEEPQQAELVPDGTYTADGSATSKKRGKKATYRRTDITTDTP